MRAAVGMAKHGVGAAACLLVGGLGFAGYALWAGQDANWDLQNYHAYVAYALLHWRYPLDVAPGGFQSYLNPLPYVLPYLLRANFDPRAAAIGVALSQALVVPAVWLLTGALPTLAGSRVARIVATALACTSAIGLSEVGTSFADLSLASLVVLGTALLLRGTSGMLGAGLLLGMATGLKLTNGVFAAGAVAALIVPWRGRDTLRAAWRLAVGGAAGFAVTGGPWAVFLYARYGNPIFPAMNSWFRSPSAALDDFVDRRFLPSGVLDALRYPFSIAAGGHPTAENPFADPRLALCLIASVLFCLGWLYRRTRGAASGHAGLWRAIAFVWACYLFWLLTFAIQRYAIALEMVASVVLLEIVTNAIGRRFQAAACLTALVGVLAVTRPADWWHRPWTDAFAPRLPAALLDPAAFIIVSHPDGYWATLLPQASRFFTAMPTEIASGGALRAQLLAGLRDAPGGQIRTLGFDLPMEASVRANLAALGYAPAAPCMRAPSLWWVDTVFCHAAPVGSRPGAAADLGQGQTADFTSAGAGWIYEVAGWFNAGQRGTSTSGTRAELVLRPATSPAVLEFGFSDVPTTAIRLQVNGQDTTTWTPGATLRIVCLPDLADHAGVADLVLQSAPATGLYATLANLTLRPAGRGECDR